MSDAPRQIIFLGAGNIAEAVARALPPGWAVTAADPSADRRAVFAGLGAATTDDARPHLAAADALLVAVKPQVAADALAPLAGAGIGNALVVSVMAGVTTARVDELLGGGRRVVRVMPNTPLLIGRGACGVCAGKGASDADLELAAALFGSAVVRRVTEAEMDAVTATSGSGPAYVFYLAEQMIAAARAVGLDAADADALVRQTILGAAEMLAAGDDPAELRRRVTSPGGTTAAAVAAFDDADLPAIVRRAITAARDRGRELSA